MDRFLGIPILPVDTWVQQFVDGFVASYRPFFQLLRLPFEYLLRSITEGLITLPPVVIIVALAALATWRLSLRFGLFVALATFVMGWLGLWNESMTSVGVVATAVFFAALIGIPSGILLAEFPGAWRVAKPLLDILQTTPSFVYLVPVVMLFGIGTVPGTIATVIFATPPLIKLTYLGLAQVSGEAIEAGVAFGSTRLQLLVHVKLPLAVETIRAGLNQTIMLSIVMSTIAAMIGAEGLGLTVLRGIARLDIGMAATGGISLILLALIFDGITQGRRRHKLDVLGVFRRLQRHALAAGR